MPAVQETVDQVRRIDVDQYKYGFETLIESQGPQGPLRRYSPLHLGEEERARMDAGWRLDAYRRWLTMREPKWAKVQYGPIDYQNLYYSAPKKKSTEIARRDRSEILRTYEKLGIPLREREALLGIKKPAMASGAGRKVRAARAMAASRSMRCSIRYRSRPHSRRNLPRPACCSCRSRRRCRSIRIW